MTALAVWAGVPVVAVRANWGRWIVDCPACPSALAVRPGDDAVECWDCGARAEASWPDPAMTWGITRLLAMRPDVSTRSWEPGESLHDLLAENLEHGLITPALAAPAGRPLLAIHGGEITVDHLPAAPARRLALMEGT